MFPCVVFCKDTDTLIDIVRSHILWTLPAETLIEHQAHLHSVDVAEYAEWNFEPAKVKSMRT
jgi:hypothetical protein